MNLEVKTGKNLKCAYTDEPSDVLIRFKQDDDSEHCSMWMGKKALEQALNTLRSIDGTQPLQSPFLPYVPNYQPAVLPLVGDNPVTYTTTTTPYLEHQHVRTPQPEQIVQPIGIKKTTDTEKELQSELFNQLSEEIERNRDQKGRVNGSEVNKFLSAVWAKRFRDPKKNAFPVVNSLLPQIDMDRFEHIFKIN